MDAAVYDCRCAVAARSRTEDTALSRKHQDQEPDLLAELNRQDRYWGHGSRIGQWDGRSSVQPLSRRQARTLYRFLAGMVLAGCVLIAVVLARGGKPPVFLQAVTGTALVAVIMLAGLDFLAKRALHEIHRRRWPGD